MSQQYTFKQDRYSSHKRIISLINSNQKILDIGCFKGYIAKELKEKNCKIIGIELDKEAAKEASKYCDQVINTDIEKLNFSFPNEYFDYIIIADVIEHIRNPEELLIKIKPYLKKTGSVIISTGNIANWYIRLNLLLGRFDYKDRGLLDKTHVRLYTLKSFKDLINKTEFKVKKCLVTPIPILLLFPKHEDSNILLFFHTLNYYITLGWKKLFAYQFILVVEKY